MTTQKSLSLQRIETADDPRVAVFTAIRERDLVRQGGFIAEGTVVLESLLRSPFFEAGAVLVLRNRLAGIEPLLGRLGPAVAIYVAEAEVIDAVAGFSMHRGVLAHAVRRGVRVPPLADRLRAIAAKKGVVVVAQGIANHDNMGGIFRNAAAFAADLVLLDESCCDPLYRKAIRVSAGAVLHVPFERVRFDALLPDLRSAGIRAFALSPRGDPDLGVLDAGGPAALFLGAEGPGLPEPVMRAMHVVRIDMAPGFDSLNVATSAAIVLQRLYSARRPLSVA